MILSVSKVSGTCGSAKIGRVEGSSPRSPTVRRFSPNHQAASVSTPIATRGEGTALVR